MNPDQELTAAEIAQYDQALADTRRFLREVVEAYRYARAVDVGNGVPETISVMALASELGEAIPSDSLASVLTTAIVTLAESQR